MMGLWAILRYRVVKIVSSIDYWGAIGGKLILGSRESFVVDGVSYENTSQIISRK